MGRSFKTEGIVVKRRNAGEADRILTLFTKTHGKITVRATGVRRIASRRSGHIELLNLTQVTLYIGHKYPVLTEAQTLENFSSIKEDLLRIGFAYHFCELIDGLCPENQENRAVFELLRTGLTELGETKDIVETVHGFEVELLTLLGFWNKSQSVEKLNTHLYIENILERRLKSRKIFSKLQ